MGFVFTVILASTTYPSGVPLNPAELSAMNIIGLAVGVGLILSVLVLYGVTHDKDLHKLLFGGDEKIR